MEVRLAGSQKIACAEMDKEDNKPLSEQQDENTLPVLGKIIKVASSGADAVAEAFKNTAADLQTHGALGAIKLVASDVKELLLEGAQSMSTLAAPLNPWSDNKTADVEESRSEDKESQPESKFIPIVRTVFADVEKSISTLGGWISNNLGVNRTTAEHVPASTASPTCNPPSDAVE